MLKRKKKEPEDADVQAPRHVVTGNTRGVSSDEDILQRYWLFGAAGVLAVLLAGFAYLLLLRDSGLQQEQVRRVSESYASQQAAGVQAVIDRYGERLKAAASSPLALAAIASGNPEDVALVEKAMQDYFPTLISLRLVPLGKLGTAGLAGEKAGLRNHIEIDLLRRAAEEEPAPPESYRVDGAWMTSFAKLIQHPQQSDRRAVILATIDNRILVDTLAALAGDAGKFSLQQIYRKGNFVRADDIAVIGSGDNGDIKAEATLNDDTWNLVFTPSDVLLASYGFSPVPLIVAFALMVAAALGILLTVHLRARRALEDEATLVIQNPDRDDLRAGGDARIGTCG